MKKVIFWKGDANREMKFKLPCDCGCDYIGMSQAEMDRYVGYIIGSDGNGMGMTVWLTRAEYEAYKKQEDEIIIKEVING